MPHPGCGFGQSEGLKSQVGEGGHRRVGQQSLHSGQQHPDERPLITNVIISFARLAFINFIECLSF